MEKHTDDYYKEQQSLHNAMGLEYDLEYNKLQDDINYRINQERYSHLYKQCEINDNSKYLFATINPNPQITLLDFIKTIEKIISKKWVTNYLYVIEQRGENIAEIGKGFHLHIILEKPKKPFSHIIRELGNTANRVCDTSNFHFFNIKSISEEECQRKIVYLTGRKADEAKHLKQEMDIHWRIENKIKSFYNVGII